VSNKDLIASEMIRMRIRKDVIPHMDVGKKMLEYSKTLEREKKNLAKLSQTKK
jgi:hypothetical protein